MLRNVTFYFNFQIDKDAVNVMGEKDLVQLGLIAKGDTIKLRSFCKRGIDVSSDIISFPDLVGEAEGENWSNPICTT